MKPYLKYYFGFDDRLYLDSISVNSDVMPEPANFITWYEEGDFVGWHDKEAVQRAALKSDSSIFTALFAPRKVSIRVLNALREKQNATN